MKLPFRKASRIRKAVVTDDTSPGSKKKEQIFLGSNHTNLVGGFNFRYVFMFTPILGEMIQFDEHIFQMGWFKPPTINTNVWEFPRDFPYKTVLSLGWCQKMPPGLRKKTLSEIKSFFPKIGQAWPGPKRDISYHHCIVTRGTYIIYIIIYTQLYIYIYTVQCISLLHLSFKANNRAADESPPPNQRRGSAASTRHIAKGNA